MASSAGTEALAYKRDCDRARRLICRGRKQGEKIASTPSINRIRTPHAMVTADIFQKLGTNLETAATDWEHRSPKATDRPNRLESVRRWSVGFGPTLDSGLRDEW